MNRVEGYCPLGCGQTLLLGDGGHVTCSSAECPAPAAVSDILADGETEHLVTLGDATFNVKHPLRERLNDELLHCEVGEHLARLNGPPRPDGTYRMRIGPKGFYVYERVV